MLFLLLYSYVAPLVQANLFISSALSGFGAQPCRLATSFCASKSTYDVVKFSDKRDSKRPKKPQNRPFLLGIAVHSGLRGGSMSPRLFLQQNTAKPEFYYLSPNCRILRSLAWLATWSLSFLNRHTGLSWGLHGDIYGRNEEVLSAICRHSLLLQMAIITSQQPRSTSLFS